VVGDAIKCAQLVRADPQNILQGRGNGLPAARPEARERRIEFTLPPEDPGGHFVRQPPIGISEPSHGIFERLVKWPSLLHLRQDRQRGPAGRDASGVAVFGGQGGLQGQALSAKR
jgi:hypothetical protein